MDMRIPPLNIEIMFQSNPLKSRILVRRLAVAAYTMTRSPLRCVARKRFSSATSKGRFLRISLAQIMSPRVGNEAITVKAQKPPIPPVHL